MSRGRRNGRKPSGDERSPSASPERGGRARRSPARLAALDLGTNNCRLLIATPRGREFRVIDAFSRIVRLGEGLSQTGALSESAMDRAVDALKVCAEKVEKRGVTRGRYIATQACRAASNGDAFLERVREETGLAFEVISTAEEARLSVSGCADLFDEAAEAALVFDIGGGSTEVSWVRPRAPSDSVERGRRQPTLDIVSWLSLPIGVVNLSERWGGGDVDRDTYDRIIESVRDEIRTFDEPDGMREVFARGGAHFLGTSGTVTSIAGVHLELPRYRRDLVDGLWLSADEAREVSERLRAMDYETRASEPSIGRERADLVVCGCAILEALLREWPVDRIRVGDRGLREGILSGLAAQSNRRRRRRRRKKRPAEGAPRTDQSTEFGG
ncbi:MAG: Ppx/GppA phosphatase family protein [Pseudomonadota bacterium]